MLNSWGVQDRAMDMLCRLAAIISRPVRQIAVSRALVGYCQERYGDCKVATVRDN